MKILVAEDDRISAAVLEKCLRNWGHEVVGVRDGAGALAAYGKHGTPLVISDWMMPEMDGLELIRRIRALPGGETAYIILLTAKSRKADLVEGLEAGADDFLSKPFDRDELRVRVEVGRRIVTLQRDLALQNSRVEREMRIAAAVQRTLLPRRLPEQPGYRFAWRLESSDKLSGDILNIQQLTSDKVAAYVLDVSGHGVVAALLSVTVSRFLSPAAGSNSVLYQAGEDAGADQTVAGPAEVCDRLNELFPLHPQTGQFFTTIFGVLDTRSHEFEFVSAGHPGLLHWHDGAATLRETPSFPVGVHPEPHYRSQSVTLAEGDRLLLYSDGLVEATDGSGCPFGIDRLRGLVGRLRGVPLDETVATLYQSVADWAGPHRLKDDVSVVAIERRGEGP